MATILDLFKSQKKDLYGLSGTAIIESRGIINPPRLAALVTSSPDALADLIGNQIGGALGGNPNRVSDTIFRKPKGVTTKPVTLPAVTQALLRDSVDAGSEDYFIKPTPAPGSIFANIKQGGSNPLGAAAALAAGALNTFGSKRGINRLKEKLKFKTPPNPDASYGAKWTYDEVGGNVLRKQKYSFSDYKPVYGEADKAGTSGRNLNKKRARPGELVQTGIEERGAEKFNTFDNTVSAVSSEIVVYDDKLNDWKTNNNSIGVVNVIIKPYGKTYNIILPGTISGLSEDFTNEVNNVKYVGSPFNVYRYTGVERNIKFELKLYYSTKNEKTIMMTKINSLKELMFPYDEMSQITYGEGTGQTSQIAYSPNLISLSIDGYYNKIFGIMTTLSVSVEDNVAWAFDDYSEGSKDKAYPTVVNISFGMKVIETPTIDTTGGKTRFRYNFDGNETKTASQIDFEKISNVKALVDNQTAYEKLLYVAEQKK